MYLGRVIGTVVATRKVPGLDGIKFLVVQPVDHAGKSTREPEVACDPTVRAGPGDLVSLVGSREASLAMPDKFVPVDAAIVGIVDSVDVVDPGRTHLRRAP
ncbi:MAG: EutN/CcmL family microcompartment protein [Deltaproteobacteria bacterium]|nr:EutN/CcmL family microcompartment protein [Deltaproteobacteria bacterium]